MLHLKQILHKPYTTISSTILQIKTDLKSLGVVPQNLAFQENLGKLLYSLMLLKSIVLLMGVTSILSLLSLLKMTLKKLQELWTLTEVPGFNVQYILCRWADAVKNTILTSKKSQKHVWSEVGASHQDSTYHSLEMPGGLENMFDEEQFINDQHKRAMQAQIDSPEKRAREAGL